MIKPVPLVAYRGDCRKTGPQPVSEEAAALGESSLPFSARHLPRLARSGHPGPRLDMRVQPSHSGGARRIDSKR